MILYDVEKKIEATLERDGGYDIPSHCLNSMWRLK